MEVVWRNNFYFDFLMGLGDGVCMVGRHEEELCGGDSGVCIREAK